MKMTDIVTNFPPQTYSSSFFINRLGDESGSKIHECAKETHQTSSNLLDCFISKVFPKFIPSSILAFLLLLSSLPQIAETMECKASGKVRVFKSLVEFQNNKISFNPDNENFQGNNVDIETQTDGLMKNSFVTLDSDFIFKMNLENQKISRIDDNSFYSLTCLHGLSLSNNLIKKLSRETFRGLTHLRQLNLGDNVMKEVPEFVFMVVWNLKYLNLTRNKIAMLHAGSFSGMDSLEVLDLSHNDLYQIVPEVFQYFTSLQYLLLDSNEIAYADADDWHNMKNLTALNLTDNALERFDTAYNFAFTEKLRELYLGKNFLTKFNAIGVRVSFPNLMRLDISDNPFSCVELDTILKDLNQTKVIQIGRDAHPEEPTIGGISCNKSMEWYEHRKEGHIHTPTSPSPIVPPTETPKPNSDPIIIDNPAFESEIHRLYTIISWLLGLVLFYIFCDTLYKFGFCRWAVIRAYRYRRQPQTDAADSEFSNLHL